MKVLIWDPEGVGLPLAMRAQDAGHHVRLWIPPQHGEVVLVGEGIVERVQNWKASMTWADLIIMTDNSKFANEMEPFFKRGFPIVGANKQAAKLELDRGFGQNVLSDAGVKVLPFKVFSNYKQAIAYVQKENRPFVSKPWGGNPDKSLSYVPSGVEDLIAMLEGWERQKLKGEFMLQEMAKGQEMAVGGWFGPGGWSKWINENWEEKRLMAGGLGPNTGEMGTVLRYVKQSNLFDDVLRPVTDMLEATGYVGYVDVNCIVDGKTPFPLEFTMRFGWPHFNLCMALHKGDPINWMADLCAGKDTLQVEEKICVGTVMATGDYPQCIDSFEKWAGYPIHGKFDWDDIYLTSGQWGPGPVKIGAKVREEDTFLTAGQYVLVGTGLGDTVMEAREACLKTCDEVKWAPHRIYRKDIGERLEKDLPELQKNGYAEGMEYD